MWGGSVRKRRTPGPEKGIQNAILDYLLTQTFIVPRVWQNSMRQAKGFKLSRRYRPLGLPDICGFMCDGRALFIEVKTLKGIRSSEQIQFAEDCAKFPVIYFVARSIEDVTNQLKKEGYLK